MFGRQPDGGPAVGVDLVGQRPQQHRLVAVGLVEVALAELLDHHALLGFKFFGRDVEPLHAVTFEPQGRLDVVFRQGDVEIGIVVVGESVVVAAGHLHRQVEVGYAARAAEHEVFEQMREPRAFGIFVACACFIEDVYRGELRDRVAVDDDRESVRQYFLFVFDHMAAKIVKKRRQE